jgi:hypothetical protein
MTGLRGLLRCSAAFGLLLGFTVFDRIAGPAQAQFPIPSMADRDLFAAAGRGDVTAVQRALGQGAQN